MLFAGEQYTLVVSQWAFNTPGQTFENTITGLAAIIPGAVGVTGDLNGDGFVDGADLAALLANWGVCADPDSCPADLTGDAMVNGADLATLLANWTS